MTHQLDELTTRSNSTMRRPPYNLLINTGQAELMWDWIAHLCEMGLGKYGERCDGIRKDIIIWRASYIGVESPLTFSALVLLQAAVEI